MKRIIFAVVLGLIWASSAYGAFFDLNVLDDTILGETAGDTVTINATTTQVAALTFGAQVDFPAGAVGAPFLVVTGSLTTGIYQTAADEIGYAVAGANVGTWDATGLQAVGFNGPIGTVTPAQGEFTNIYGNGLHYFGNGPEDLHQGYRERSEYIAFQDSFTEGSDVAYAVHWNITGVVGAGTNTVTVRDGWSELVTGGAGGPDMESTVSIGLSDYRAYTPRIESVVELTGVAGQRFEWGFYAAANEYVEILHDTAVGANWYLQVQDTVDTETIDSLVAVTADPTKLEISIEADGTIHWSIDDVAMTEVGLTNLMTANAHYHRWILTDIAAAVHTVAVDYFEVEQRKQQ